MAIYNQSNFYAVPCGRHAGKRYYRFPVKVLLNSSRACSTLASFTVLVIASKAADAANLVRDEWLHRPETEIIATGPRGGETVRYVGWESSIGHQLLAPRAPESFQFDFGS